MIGTGAGTYQFDWEKHRSIDVPLHNAHSLYLEAFAELGVIGGIIVLALVGGILWWAFCAWRDARDEQRELHAIAFAALVAMAVAFGVDWFWQIVGMGSVFFGFAAGRDRRPLRPARRPPAPGRRQGGPPLGPDRGDLRRRLGLGGGAGPAAPGRTRNRRQPGRGRGGRPAERGRPRRARPHDRAVRRLALRPARPARRSCRANTKRDLPLHNAIDREGENWQWYYLRSKVEREAGDESAAEADLEKARELNPLDPCLKTGDCG